MLEDLDRGGWTEGRVKAPASVQFLPAKASAATLAIPGRGVCCFRQSDSRA